MTDEEKIKDVYRRYWDGMIRKDTDLLTIASENSPSSARVEMNRRRW